MNCNHSANSCTQKFRYRSTVELIVSHIIVELLWRCNKNPSLSSLAQIVVVKLLF